MKNSFILVFVQCSMIVSSWLIDVKCVSLTYYDEKTPYPSNKTQNGNGRHLFLIIIKIIITGRGNIINAVLIMQQWIPIQICEIIPHVDFKGFLHLKEILSRLCWKNANKTCNSPSHRREMFLWWGWRHSHFSPPLSDRLGTNTQRQKIHSRCREPSKGRQNHQSSLPTRPGDPRGQPGGQFNWISTDFSTEFLY